MLVQSPRRRRLISLTPLIDVVFILLVFFMLASSFLKWSGIELSQPGGRAEADPPGEALPVYLNGAGDYLIGASRVDEAALPATLARELGRNDLRAVILQVDNDVTFQHMVTALGIVEKAGAEPISVRRTLKKMP